MKKLYILFIIWAIIVGSALIAGAQTTVKTDAQGNYTSVSVAKTTDKETGKFFIDSKGVKYPVRMSINGKLYYVRTAKTSGKEYRVYLKTN